MDYFGLLFYRKDMNERAPRPSPEPEASSDEAMDGKFAEEKNTPVKIPEEYEEELIQLGRETGRSEEQMREQYSRTESYVRTLVDREEGDLEVKAQKVIETAIEEVAGFSEDAGLHEKFRAELLAATKDLSVRDEDDLIREIATKTQQSFCRTMTHEEYVDWRNEAVGKIKLNEVLLCNKEGDNMLIHLAESRTKKMAEVQELVDSGLRDLSELVSEDEEVKRVTATSWIVAHRSGKKMMERLGFTIDGPISEEIRQRDFLVENRPVWTSHMDRKDFLKRYGKQ